MSLYRKWKKTRDCLNTGNILNQRKIPFKLHTKWAFPWQWHNGFHSGQKCPFSSCAYMINWNNSNSIRIEKLFYNIVEWYCTSVNHTERCLCDTCNSYSNSVHIYEMYDCINKNVHHYCPVNVMQYEWCQSFKVLLEIFVNKFHRMKLWMLAISSDHRTVGSKFSARWYHCIETFSESLALCEGNLLGWFMLPMPVRSMFLRTLGLDAVTRYACQFLTKFIEYAKKYCTMFLSISQFTLHDNHWQKFVEHFFFSKSLNADRYFLYFHKGEPPCSPLNFAVGIVFNLFSHESWNYHDSAL